MNDSNLTFRRYVLGTAMGLVILGLGNILFGHFKTAQYIEVLTVSENTLPQPNDGPNIPTIQRFIAKETLQDQRIRVKKRVDFYRVIILGGQYLVSAGGFCLLWWLIISSRNWRNPE